MTQAARWWRILQFADSGFPSGGFAHSSGLEAATRFGGLDGSEQLESFVHASIWNAGHSMLPFVAAAHDDQLRVWELDARLDAQLTNHVANRASRTQGRSFLSTCSEIFEGSRVEQLAERAQRDRQLAVHLAPLFGAMLAVMNVSGDDAMRLYLYVSLRGIVSAAVRLGLVGPHEAQRLQSRHGPTLDEVLSACRSLRVDQAATTAPVLDVVGALHDRLYARLFQS
jgi:urease accessory protein